MPRPFIHRHTVMFEETNLVGNVYFAHYVRWQGHCRELFLKQDAPTVIEALSTGQLALVTVSCSMRYLSECFAGDQIDISMRLESVGSHRIGMTFDFQREHETVATGEQEVACMARDAATGRMSAIQLPDALSKALARYRAARTWGTQ